MAPIHPDSEISSPPPPAGAYYSVKDQQRGMPPPATYRQRRRGRSPCCCCLVWLCSVLATLVVLIGIAVLVFWLVVHPKVPKYDIQNVNIAGLGSSGSSTVSTTFRLKANNRNKHIGIYYDEIHVMIYAHDGTIGDGYLPPFYQGHQNITYVDGDIGSSVASLNQATVDNIQKGEMVPLNVNVDVRARLKIGSWKSRKMTVKVRCSMQLDAGINGGVQNVHEQHCSAKLRT